MRTKKEKPVHQSFGGGKVDGRRERERTEDGRLKKQQQEEKKEYVGTECKAGKKKGKKNGERRKGGVFLSKESGSRRNKENGNFGSCRTPRGDAARKERGP